MWRSIWQRASLVMVSGWVVGASYFVVSRGLNDVFPFTTLPMYASPGSPRPSHLLAIDGEGRAFYLSRFTRWHCDPPLPPKLPPCSDGYGIPYVARDDALLVRDDPGTGREPSATRLRIVQRVWVLEERPGPPASFDCELTRCSAVPR